MPWACSVTLGKSHRSSGLGLLMNETQRETYAQPISSHFWGGGAVGRDKNLHLIGLSQKVIHWDTRWKSPGAGLVSGTAGSRALVMSPALSLSLAFVSAFHCESPLSGSITWPVGATGCPMGTRGLQNLWSRVSQLWC